MGYASDTNFVSLPSSFILPKGSPLQVCYMIIAFSWCFFTSLCGNFILQDIFKPAIMWLQDTGILIKLRDDELKAPNPIPRQKVKFNQPLSISQLATAFLLMTTGMLISISVFFVELLNRPNGKAKGAKPHKVAWGISTTRRNKNDKPVQESLVYSGPHISLEWISCCQDTASRQNQQSFIDTLTLLRKYYMHIACEIN